MIYTLIFCVLFDDAINDSDYIAPNSRVVVASELRRVWKGAVVAQIEIR